MRNKGLSLYLAALTAAPILTPPAAYADEPQQTATPAAQPGNLATLPIERETLANGLRVVMSPSRDIPTVAIAVYYNVGSRNEIVGRTGFAHLFEHMMFQGSANVGKGEHFQLVMNRGGTMNGTTSEDRTNYFETLPSNELSLGLWLEADRMRSLAITQENFENQRQTVMEERRQSYDNAPYMPSMLRIGELAYGDYFPYAHSTIGEMQDLVNAPLEAVQEFFANYYAPNNAVVVLAGDFEPAAAMALVEQHFGSIPSHTVPAYEPAPITPQAGERHDELHDANAELPAFHIAFHIPADREPDHYPLELLAAILGDGESSRLYQKLVKQDEVLQEISVATDGRRGPDLFSFWAIVADGKTAAAARNVIDSQIIDIQTNGVTARELEKAKNRVLASFVFGLQSNMQRAMRLGEYELYWGDANLIRGELARYQSVTIDDIKRVAGEYLNAENRTILDVIPGPAPAASAAQGGAQ